MAGERRDAADAAPLTFAARVESSMLWSAWADALGFITELTDTQGLRRRIHGDDLGRPIAWSRRVGGKFGVTMQLPAGCYSDDTQLRLATARSVSSGGFDVEAFAKVELTIWPAYALGGGRGTRAAAGNLAKPGATWSTNFFENWTGSGGNGAAMRIQPHVWATRHDGSWAHLDDVVRNAIITHGHPRGIIGALLHAIALTWALDRGHVPGPAEWDDFMKIAESAYRVFETDPELASYWIPKWEQDAGRPFADVYAETVHECEALFRRSLAPLKRLISCEPTDSRALSEAYEALIDEFSLRDPATRGSGTSTSIAAIVLAASLPDHPKESATTAALALGTDTDTIATMAAAIVAAASPAETPEPLQDRIYLRDEARRLAHVAAGRKDVPFPYPDLLTWQPPKSQLEVVGLAKDGLAMAGLAYLTQRGDSAATSDAAWSWTTATFGASFLVKHRRQIGQLKSTNWPRLPSRATLSAKRESPALAESVQLFDDDIRLKQGEATEVVVTAAAEHSKSAEEPVSEQTTSRVLESLVHRVNAGELDDRPLGQLVKEAAEGTTAAEFFYIMGLLRARLHSR